jgi:hypothetical protein
MKSPQQLVTEWSQIPESVSPATLESLAKYVHAECMKATHPLMHVDVDHLYLYCRCDDRNTFLSTKTQSAWEVWQEARKSKDKKKGEA